MRSPKVVKLFNLLTPKELDQLERDLSLENRSRQLRLFRFLRKQVTDGELPFGKEAVFSHLFEEPYDRSKDFLLRNEFRLLSEYLEQFLVRKAIHEEDEPHQPGFHYFLLRALHERKAHDLFQAKYNEVYKASITHSDYLLAYVLGELNFFRYSELLHESESNIETAVSINESQLKNLHLFFASAYRQYQMNKAYIYHLENPFGMGEFPTQEIQVSLDKYENEFTAYLYRKTRSYALPLKKRIAEVEKCLSFARSQQDSHFFQGEIKYCLGELSILHLFVNGYGRAKPYINAFCELDLDPGDPYRINFIFYYTCWLLKENRPDEALMKLEENEAYFEAIERFRIKLQAVRVASYALKEDKEELYRHLPLRFTEFSKMVKQFFRLYYAIFYWISGQHLDAIRETENLLNTLRKTEPGAVEFVPIIRLFKRYFNWSSLPDSPRVSKSMNRLKNDIRQYDREAQPIQKYYLPFMWLKTMMSI